MNATFGIGFKLIYFFHLPMPTHIPLIHLDIYLLSEFLFLTMAHACGMSLHSQELH